MSRLDPSVLLALGASLLLHGVVGVMLSRLDPPAGPPASRPDARSFDGGSERVPLWQAAAAPPLQHVAVLPELPPMRFGEPDGKGAAATAAPGERPQEAPLGPQDQAFLSRDPEGPGAIPDAPSGFTGLTGEGGDGRPAGVPQPRPYPSHADEAELLVPPRMPAMALRIPAPTPPMMDAAPTDTPLVQPDGPPDAPPQTPPPEGIAAAIAREPVDSSLSEQSPSVEATLQAIASAVEPPQQAPHTPVVGDAAVPAAAPPAAPPASGVDSSHAAQHPPQAATPSAPGAAPGSLVPSAPVATAVASGRAASAAPPAPIAPSAPADVGGTGRPPGMPVASADPAPQGDAESDPFSSTVNSVIIRPGHIEARAGRQIKPVRPRLSIKARIDLATMVAPRVVFRVAVDETGKVTDVRIIRSSGSNEVDLPTKVALYEWWIEPLKDKQGRPRPDVIQLTISWQS